jgi:hypothetical protein
LRERFEGLHPVTQEILDLLEFYKEVGELIEHARVSDFEACRALRTLIDKGLLRVLMPANDTAVPAAHAVDDLPLLDQETLYNLRLSLSLGLNPQKRILRAKLCMLSDDERIPKDFLVGLLRLPGMELFGHVEALKRGFGRLGAMRLSENLFLDVVLIPFERSLRPLWMTLGTGTVAVLLMRMSAEDALQFSPQQVTHTGNFVVTELQPAYAASGITGAIILDPTNPAQVREVLQKILYTVSSNPRHYYE